MKNLNFFFNKLKIISILFFIIPSIYTIDNKPVNTLDNNELNILDKKNFRQESDLTADTTKNDKNNKDLTDDSGKNKKNRKISPIFSFYSKDEFYSIFSNQDIITLSKITEVNLSMFIPIKLYTFSAYINNNTFVDFNEINNVISRSNAQDQNLNKDIPNILLINNLFSTGIGNEFNFKNKVKISLNCDYYINSPFNDNISFIILPSIIFSGNYYYGFYWLLEEIFMPELYVVNLYNNYNNYNLTGSTHVNFGYEFFRFYGPTKFRLGLDIDDYVLFVFPSINNPYYYNKFKAGFYIKFSDIKFYNYFIMNTTGEYNYNNGYINYTGFISGIESTIKWFKLSIYYTGYVDTNQSNLNINNIVWYSELDFYIKFSL